MFLSDVVEFGRKVKISKPTYRDDTNWDTRTGSYLSNLKIADTPAIRMSYEKYQTLSDEINEPRLKKYPMLQGNTRLRTYQITKKDGKLANTRSRRVLQNDLDDTNPRVDEIRYRTKTNPKARRYGGNKTKPAPKTPVNKPNIKSTLTSIKPKTNKIINKYTLGAAGLVGASAAGYGGYKLLTRNKKRR